MQQFVFNEEMARAGAPRPNFLAIGLAGPTIIVHGTEEQKREHLSGILSGETFWCQGFSEPGSGSDLASLQTRAVADGDDFIINGQKIWTSGAHRADRMMLLARTDADAPKHKGISYFLLNMKTPGITVRPLTNMADTPSFNEVFFDNVRVPKSDLLGELNRGWYVRDDDARLRALAASSTASACSGWCARSSASRAQHGAARRRRAPAAATSWRTARSRRRSRSCCRTAS